MLIWPTRHISRAFSIMAGTKRYNGDIKPLWNFIMQSCTFVYYRNGSFILWQHSQCIWLRWYNFTALIGNDYPQWNGMEFLMKLLIHIWYLYFFKRMSLVFPLQKPLYIFIRIIISPCFITTSAILTHSITSPLSRHNFNSVSSVKCLINL